MAEDNFGIGAAEESTPMPEDNFVKLIYRRPLKLDVHRAREIQMASKKTTGKKEAAKKARGGGSGPTKSDFVREKLKAGMSAAEIVKAAAERKMTIAPAMVYKLRSRLSGGGGKKRTLSKRKAIPKKKGGKLSASNFIRKYPTKSANEIAALAKKAGIKMSVGLVYTTRSYDKKAKGKTTRKPGPKSKTPVFQVFPGGGGGSEAELKQAALAVGFPRALKVVEDLSRKFEAVQRQYQALLG